MRLLLPSKRWHLTGAGWLFLVVGGLMVGLGIAKNINLLALLGLALLALLLLNAERAGRGLGALRGNRKLEVLPFADSLSPVEVNLRSPLVLRGLVVEEGGPAWSLDVLDGRATCQGEARLPGRGWHERPALTASSGHPFGLVRRAVELEPARRVLVLPVPAKIDRERLRAQLRGADPRGERVRRRGWRHEGAQADFHGLRPFRAGDSPRWIHWRTSARRGELMVREFEDVPGDDLLLVVVPGGDVERTVSLAAGVCWEWCRRRGDRLALLAGGQLLDDRTGPAHARALLECLAALPAGALPEPDLGMLDGLSPAVAVVVAGPDGAAVEARVGRPVARVG